MSDTMHLDDAADRARMLLAKHMMLRVRLDSVGHELGEIARSLEAEPSHRGLVAAIDTTLGTVRNERVVAPIPRTA